MIKKVLFLLVCIFFKLESVSIEQIYSQLTVRQKIAQLFMIDIRPNIENEVDFLKNQFHIDIPKEQKTLKGHIQYLENLITEYNIGGLIFMSADLNNEISYIRKFQKLSTDPLLIAQDAEWGLNMRIPEIEPFPYNLTLGALPADKDYLIEEQCAIIGEQIERLGIHINFAPVADINNNPNNPIINHRSFGENKKHVARKSIAAMNGLIRSGIIPCAKHFPGHGNTDVDSHKELPTLHSSMDELYKTELYPFIELIKHNIPALMTGHISLEKIDTTPHISATLSKKCIALFLQEELGFKGITITDALGMQAIAQYFSPEETAYMALMAGNDILLMPEDVPTVINYLEKKALEDPDFKKLIEEKCKKILILKNSIGLFDNLAIPSNKCSLESFNTKQNKQLKKKIYESAITLVKNENNALPLQSSDEPILLISIEDENNSGAVLQNQLKRKLPNLKYISGNKIPVAIHPNYQTIIISLHILNQFPQEKFGITQKLLASIQKLIKEKRKVILVLFTNPYSLKYFKNEKAIVVGYQNNSESQKAMANILLGKINPQGKLPVTASDNFYEGLGLTF